jgi:chromosome segregation ATPase
VTRPVSGEIRTTVSESEDVVLPDISFYEEHMASLQHVNSQLSSNINDLERTILAYKRRCEAQDEAKNELQRQVDELGSWLSRVRKSEAEKDRQIGDISSELSRLKADLDELIEERDTLAAENRHYQSLRVTDEYLFTFCSHSY